MTLFARSASWAMVVGLVFGLGGCATGGDGSRVVGAGGHGQWVVGAARELPVFDGASGAEIGWDGLVARVGGADVVIVGEVHGHAMGGAASVALFADVVATTGRTPALSLEFFERDAQAGVDDYLTGITDEAVFRAHTGRTEGNYPAAHAAMVEAAKAAGRPVIASNAPRRYSTVARKDGYARVRGLRPDQARLFVVPDAEIEGAYRDRFFELMKGMVESHGGPGASAGGSGEPDPDAEKKMVEGFYRAQNVWDATMAASIVDGVHEGWSPVVHIVGQFHSDFDGGLVQRVRSAAPGARVVTVSLVNETAWRDEDRGRADVVVLIGEKGIGQ